MAYPNDNTTTVDTQIIPQVMSQMVLAKLPKAIRFSPLAITDTTLVNMPGDTVTMPRFKYIGDATDFGPGEKISYGKLTTGTTTTTIKRAGRGVEVDDFSVLKAIGHPKDEAARQLAMAIGAKVDGDCLDALLNARLSLTHAAPDLDLIDALEAVFEDDKSEFNIEDENPVHGTLIMNLKDFGKLRKAVASDWTRASELGDSVLLNGTLGSIFGWQISTSRKVPEGTYLATKPGALGITLKRGIQVETARDIDYKTTKVNADEYYGVWLRDDTRALVVNRPAGYSAPAEGNDGQPTTPPATTGDGTDTGTGNGGSQSK